MLVTNKQNECISQLNINPLPLRPHKKGLCIFININKGRIHSEEDVARAYNTFTGLDYEVEVYRDVSGLQLYDILEKVRVKLNSQVVAYESLVVIVGAHGDAEGMQMYDGERVRAEEIVTPFLPHRCPGLSGKAKLFFFQSCRGLPESASSCDAGREGEELQSEDVVASFSGAFGENSYRFPQGSLYIQTLCDLLESPVCSRSLFPLLRELSERVREESVRRGLPEQDPVFWSGVLTNDFYFRYPWNYSSVFTPYEPVSVPSNYSSVQTNLITNYDSIPTSHSFPSHSVPSNYSSSYLCHYCGGSHTPDRHYNPTPKIPPFLSTTAPPNNYSSVFT